MRNTSHDGPCQGTIYPVHRLGGKRDERESGNRQRTSLTCKFRSLWQPMHQLQGNEKVLSTNQANYWRKGTTESFTPDMETLKGIDKTMSTQQALDVVRRHAVNDSNAYAMNALGIAYHPATSKYLPILSGKNWTQLTLWQKKEPSQHGFTTQAASVFTLTV